MQDKDKELTDADYAVARRAKEARVAKGLSLMQVATAMGRTYQCVYGMEISGTRSTRVAADWARALDVPVPWLLFGVGSTDDVVVPRKMLQEAASLMDARRGRRRDLVAEILQVLT